MRGLVHQKERVDFPFEVLKRDGKIKAIRTWEREVRLTSNMGILHMGKWEKLTS